MRLINRLGLWICRKDEKLTSTINPHFAGSFSTPEGRGIKDGFLMGSRGLERLKEVTNDKHMSECRNWDKGFMTEEEEIEHSVKGYLGAITPEQ